MNIKTTDPKSRNDHGKSKNFTPLFLLKIKTFYRRPEVRALNCFWGSLNQGEGDGLRFFHDLDFLLWKCFFLLEKHIFRKQSSQVLFRQGCIWGF